MSVHNSASRNTAGRTKKAGAQNAAGVIEFSTHSGGMAVVNKPEPMEVDSGQPVRTSSESLTATVLKNSGVPAENQAGAVFAVTAERPTPGATEINGNSLPTLARLDTDIRELAKGFCANQRVARKYQKDKAKIVSFLKLIGSIATREAPPILSPDAVSEVGDVPVPPLSVTFTRTVEELGIQSGLTVFEVDKYLRWTAKGLQVLQCDVPDDRAVCDRIITIDPRDARDLDNLFDPTKRVGLWDLPVEVAINGFKYKSLSTFSLNVAIGCFFGCHFCYVPSASTLSLGWRLLRYGILDADSEWGTYCLIRRWDEEHFRKSLRRLLALPASELAPDGNMAIMMCTNTDPYQPVFHPDPAMRVKLQDYLRTVVRHCLEVLLEPEFQRFQVRIQTRGLDAENDFDLMEKFGNRLLLGMSIPSLNNRMVKVYEPKAPAPTRRIDLLTRAAERKIPIYVAMAPTFPECDEGDIRNTLTAFSKLPVVTIFHETVNARANNVDRIVEEASRREMPTQAEVIRYKSTRIPYAIGQLRLVEKVAGELGLEHKLHLWPDEELLDDAVVNAQPDPVEFRAWIKSYHGRISEWPGKNGAGSYEPYARPDASKAASDLNTTEKRALAKAIADVRGLRKSQYKAGKALQLIVDQKLHRPATIEDFCQAEFGFSRQYGHCLIDFANLIDNLSTTVDKSRLPTGEAQGRPIMREFRDEPDNQRAAWTRACELALDDVPDAELVRAAVAELREPMPPRQPREKTIHLNRTFPTRVFSILGELQGAVKAGDEPTNVVQLVEQLREELHQIFGEAA